MKTKFNLVGAMLRPVIGGRAIPPRGTRIMPVTEVTETIVAEIARGMEHGALRVRLRVGAQKDLTLDQIRALAGLPVSSAPVESAAGFPLAEDTASPEPISLPEPPAEIEIPAEPRKEAIEEPVISDEASAEAPVEEVIAPVATVDDLLEPEPAPVDAKKVYDEAGLLEMKSDELSELLVAEFGYPSDQLYKLKTKAAKVAEILSRQGE